MRTPKLIVLLTMAASLSAAAAEQTTVRTHPSINLGQERLIAYYPFDGDANDASGNQLNPVSSSELRFTQGEAGKALALDGRTFVELPLDLNPELFEEVKVTYSLRLDALPEDPDVLKALQPKSYVLSNAYQGLSFIQNVKGTPSLSAHNSGATAGTGYSHPIPRERWIRVRIVSTLVEGQNADGDPETRIRVQLDSDNYSDVSEQVYRPGTSYQTLIVGAFDKKAGWATRGTIDELRIFASGSTETEDAVFKAASRVNAIPQGLESAVASVTPIRHQLPAAATGFDQNADLVAHFPFDGDARAAVGGFSPLSSEGTSATTGRIGQALAFDGESFLELPIDLNHEAYPEQTISMWIRSDSTEGLAKEALDAVSNSAYPLSNSYHGLLHVGGVKKDTYMRGVAANTIVSGGGKHRVMPDSWTHVAVVSRLVDGVDADGKPQKQVETEIHSGPYITRNKKAYRKGSTYPTLLVGAWNTSAEYGFRGAIDDLRIYSRALGAEEVLALATSAPRASDTSPLSGLAAREPITDAANLSQAPDADMAETNERLDEVAEVAQAPDWRVTKIISVSPQRAMPGDLITVRVEVEKNDPLNQMPRARVGSEGSGSYAQSHLNTSIAQPTASVEKIVNWRIPADISVHGDASVDAPFLISLFDDTNSPLQDSELSNNSMRASVRVYAPVVQVCGNPTFWDSRWSRSDNSGSRLGTSGRDSNNPLGGIDVDIWVVRGACRDTRDGCRESDDEKLDSTMSSLDSGKFCVAAPRLATIYAMTTLETSIARIKTANDDTPVISSHSMRVRLVDSPQTLDWSVSCPGAKICDTNLVSQAKNAQTIRWGNAIATLVDVERYYGSTEVISPRIDVYVNSDAPEVCRNAFEATDSNGSPSPNNMAKDGKLICVATPNSNHRVAHEVGHIVMSRALKIDDSPLAKVTANSAWTDIDNEKLATSEGFANFFAAAVYWEQVAVDPFYQNSSRPIEGDTTAGNGSTAKSCISRGDEPHRIEGNVARFFWDLYDATSDASGNLVDDTSRSLVELVDAWKDFKPGVLDRQAEEGGTDDAGLKSNGRNAWDYMCRLREGYSELRLNCLGEQNGAVLPNDVNSSCIY